MNQADSEKIAASLEKKGYQPAEKIEKADLVVINTCSVRQSAENRVLGLIRKFKTCPPTGRIKNLKLKIIVTGCLLYHDQKWLKKKMPNVTFLSLKDLVKEEVKPKRNDQKHAFVTIMEGCNNFCTYCVVPFSRGRERSRSFEEIICEVEGLAKRGYQQITLLGQNVNSYGKDFNYQFARLLVVLHTVKGIKKISFITSNPQDLTDDIIAAMKLPKIDRYLHLPVQSGDDSVLKRMNRQYTSARYLRLVTKIKMAIPDVQIGTDIIVGFPGETKKAFANTVKLCRQIGFVKAYIAKYSPRPGTAAFKMKDDVPAAEKKHRWLVLENLINKKFHQKKNE